MIHFPRCHAHKAVRWVLAVYWDLSSGCCQRPPVLPSLRLAMRLRGLLHSRAVRFQEQISQENKPPFASTYQASKCIILANIPLATESSMTKSRVIRGGRAIHKDINTSGSLLAIKVTVYHRAWSFLSLLKKENWCYFPTCTFFISQKLDTNVS